MQSGGGQLGLSAEIAERESGDDVGFDRRIMSDLLSNLIDPTSPYGPIDAHPPIATLLDRHSKDDIIAVIKTLIVGSGESRLSWQEPLSRAH